MEGADQRCLDSLYLSRDPQYWSAPKRKSAGGLAASKHLAKKLEPLGVVHLLLCCLHRAVRFGIRVEAGILTFRRGLPREVGRKAKKPLGIGAPKPNDRRECLRRLDGAAETAAISSDRLGFGLEVLAELAEGVRICLAASHGLAEKRHGGKALRYHLLFFDCRKGRKDLPLGFSIPA